MGTKSLAVAAPWLVGLACAAAILVAPPSAVAQEASGVAAPPDTVAAEMRRAVRSLAWGPLAHRLHPEALATFRMHVEILVEHDRSAEMLDRLLGGVTPGAFAGLSDAEVFTRVMGALQEETPGLIHALANRVTEVIGAVPEGSDTAHVVYRVLPGISGERPRLAVMTLARAEGSWRVLHAEELEVIQTALRGLPGR